MEIISNCTKDTIKRAAQALKDGHLVAFPTETVYGLGADATNEKAVSRIYSVKGRPVDHPLIVHISSIKQLDNWTIEIPDYAIKIAREFWPGPMTLILKRSDLAQDFITGRQNNVGVRVPSQSVALELLSEFEKLGGLGIAAPSANRFGAVSPTNVKAVKEELDVFLQTEDLILDGGQSSIGIESTIIDCTKSHPVILRPGAITVEMIENILGVGVVLEKVKKDIKVSGLLESHYSPKARVLLDTQAKPGNGLIAFSSVPTPLGVIRLAEPHTIEEYAKVLYSALREADKKGIEVVIVVLPSGSGLATAIIDRLKKASIKSVTK
jgi:L-threonylcarbamoyladenylate synthase